MKLFKLPDLGEGLQDAEIVEWKVKVGDEVAADDIVAAVETAKAVVEIPAPFAGRVARLFGAVGDIVPLGAPLIGFEGGEEDAGAIVGETPRGPEITERAREPVAAAVRSGNGLRVAPAVRALARELNVKLESIAPSARNGAISAEDVRRAARRIADIGSGEPVRGVRRAMAQAMARARAEVAPASVMDDADVEAWPAGEDITIRLVRALVAGCAAEPALNAWFDPRNLSRRLMRNVDVAIAVDLPEGLFAPVLRDVGARANADLRRGLDRLRADAAARRIPVEEMRDSTIALSNFGAIAGRYAAPIIVPPTVAILAAGRARPQVVAAEGAPAIHRMLPLSLTFDHRVVTGGEAARFLAAVIASLEGRA